MELDKSLPTDNYSAWIQNLESASARVRADRDEMLVKSLAGYGLTISANNVSSGTYKTPDGVWISISRQDSPPKLYVGPRARMGLPPSGFFDPDAFPSADDFIKHSAMLGSQISQAKWHIDNNARSTATVDPAEARIEELAKRSKYPSPQISYGGEDARFGRWFFGGTCVVLGCIIIFAVIQFFAPLV